MLGAINVESLKKLEKDFGRVFLPKSKGINRIAQTLPKPFDGDFYAIFKFKKNYAKNQ